MKYLKLLLIHTQCTCLELFRQPMYLVSTVLFPSMFFWFFGIPNAKEPGAIAILTASFSAFAVLSVVLFQFAVGISQERDSSWYYYVRSLPYPKGLQLISRLLAGLLFSALGIGGVIATALIFSDLKMADIAWLGFLLKIYLGAIPFAVMGICLGLGVNSRTVLPMANLIYLPLSFAGGLWMPPNILPKVVQDISVYLPTRMYGEILWADVLKTSVEVKNIYGLVGYGAVFFVLALVLFQRVQEKNFK